MLIFFLLCGVGGQSLSAQKVKWTTFSSHIGKAKIKFPEKPEVVVKQSKKGDAYACNAYLGDIIFMFTFVMHNGKISSDPKRVQKSLDSFISASRAKVIDQSEFSYKKHTGKNATVTLPGKGLIIDYRVLIVKQVEYQYMVVSPEAERNEKLIKKFFKSFKLLKS